MGFYVSLAPFLLGAVFFFLVLIVCFLFVMHFCRLNIYLICPIKSLKKKLVVSVTLFNLSLS